MRREEIQTRHAYNRSSLAHELGMVELHKGFVTHRPRLSFNYGLPRTGGFGGYDYGYAPHSAHRNKSARVSAVDPNVNGNFKSPGRGADDGERESEV